MRTKNHYLTAPHFHLELSLCPDCHESVCMSVYSEARGEDVRAIGKKEGYAWEP